MQVKTIYLILTGIVLLGFVALALRDCNKPVIPPTNGNTVQVTPVTITPAVQNQLPNGQTGHVQIVVPKPTPIIGMIPTQNVVPTDQGNTIIVTTDKLDWGFKLEPKFILGYDDKVFGGVGLGIFRIWRFDTDLLLTISGKDLENDVNLGIGESFKILTNTSLGLSYQLNSKLDKRLGVYISLAF